MIPLSGLIFWVDVIVKLFTKNACLFYKFWKRLLVKSLLAKSFKKTFHSAYTESHKYMFRIFFFFQNFEVLIIPVANGSLLYLTPP